MTAARVKVLADLAAEVVSGFGCDLEDLVVKPTGKRRLVRVVVGNDEGLSLDLVAEISREFSRRLDVSEIFGETPYVLEVTSPGVDRPLTLPRHWSRAVGRLVEVTTLAGAKLVGRVDSVSAGEVILMITDAPTSISFDAGLPGGGSGRNEPDQ